MCPDECVCMFASRSLSLAFRSIRHLWCIASSGLNFLATLPFDFCAYEPTRRSCLKTKFHFPLEKRESQLYSHEHWQNWRRFHDVLVLEFKPHVHIYNKSNNANFRHVRISLKLFYYFYYYYYHHHRYYNLLLIFDGFTWFSFWQGALLFHHLFHNKWCPLSSRLYWAKVNLIYLRIFMAF